MFRQISLQPSVCSTFPWTPRKHTPAECIMRRQLGEPRNSHRINGTQFMNHRYFLPPTSGSSMRFIWFRLSDGAASRSLTFISQCTERNNCWILILFSLAPNRVTLDDFGALFPFVSADALPPRASRRIQNNGPVPSCVRAWRRRPGAWAQGDCTRNKKTLAVRGCGWAPKCACLNWISDAHIWGPIWQKSSVHNYVWLKIGGFRKHCSGDRYTGFSPWPQPLQRRS